MRRARRRCRGRMACRLRAASPGCWGRVGHAPSFTWACSRRSSASGSRPTSSSAPRRAPGSPCSMPPASMPPPSSARPWPCSPGSCCASHSARRRPSAPTRSPNSCASRPACRHLLELQRPAGLRGTASGRRRGARVQRRRRRPRGAGGHRRRGPHRPGAHRRPALRRRRPAHAAAGTPGACARGREGAGGGRFGARGPGPPTSNGAAGADLAQAPVARPMPRSPTCCCTPTPATTPACRASTAKVSSPPAIAPPGRRPPS